MNVSRTNIVLAVLLVMVALLSATIHVDHSHPNVEFLPDMKRSPASSAFAANRVFATGRTLQSPVAGTIARGDLPLHYAPTKEDAVRAGEELQNPYTKASTIPASIQRGEPIYRVSCVPCHGPTGAGDGPVAKRGFPPPPPLTTGKSVNMKDGQLFHILTYGQGSMASMVGQLSRNRRWDVINFVRSLQKKARKSAPPTAGVSTTSPVASPVASPVTSPTKTFNKPHRRSGTEKGKP